jgi:ABC-type glycerol-3-phosphate transport system permease component
MAHLALIGLRKIRQVAVINVILFLVALLFIIPFYYMAVGGFKFQQEIANTFVTLLPQHPTLENYQRIFAEYPIPLNALNSFTVAISVTALNLFFCSLAGLAFARFKFPGRDALFVLALLTMMIPSQSTLVPLFVIMSRLHWINSLRALIIPNAIGAFGIFFLRQYIDGAIPLELLDAARIDGCSDFGVYRRVVVPVIKPAMIVLGLILFMNAWNDYLWPMVMLNQNSKYTMSLVVGIAGLRAYELNWGEKLAAATVAAFPPVILFLFFRKQFVEAILGGAFKGI